METSKNGAIDPRVELSDPEEGEIVDSSLVAAAEDELEEGELPVEAMESMRGNSQELEKTIPRDLKQALPLIDSAGWNNEINRRGKEEETMVTGSLPTHMVLIGRRLLEFERLSGRDYSMEKNRHEKIIGVMFGAMDRVQTECQLGNSDEETQFRTNRNVRRVSRILTERKSKQEELRRRVGRMGIHLKASPLTANFDEESLIKPFVVNHPPPHPRSRATIVPEEIRECSSIKPSDPRIAYREQMELSKKRERVLITELAENQLYRKLERQDRKRKRFENERPFSRYPPTWTGSDVCEFGELITTPTTELPVSLSVYRDLDPDHSPTHVKIQLKDNTSSKAKVSVRHLATLETLGMEVPEGVDGDLVEEILDKAGSIAENSDLRNVEMMDKRLSGLLYESRIYENQHAVSFILQVICKLKGEASMVNEEKKSEVGKGSIIALNVRAGPHHRRRIIDEVKREVIRGFYREEFIDKAVASTLADLIGNPSLLDKTTMVSKHSRFHGRNNMVMSLEERGRGNEQMSWS